MGLQGARPKTIYMFGAGASAAESPFAPTNADLLPQGLAARPEAYPTLVRFLASWGFRGGAHLPTIEELFALLDAALTRGEPLGQRWTISDLTRCREELDACIYDHIAETIDEGGLDRSPDRGLYARLCATLPDEDVVLMTLNYDLLLDEALRDAGRVPVYGLDFQAEVAHDGGSPRRPVGRPIELFKLHGSLDWAYCPGCSSTMRDQGRRLGGERACPTCGSRMRGLIVPPTPIKVPPSPFLSGLWKKAEWRLAQAHEVVFIGYSLGEADANIRYMLFRAFYGYAPRVTVVLKGQDPGRDATLAGRYARLFPGGVRVRWGGFEEFVADLAGADGLAADQLDHRFPAE